MEASRVKEIMMSDHTIDVKYQGRSVWIDGLDAEARKATVHPLDQESAKQTVNIGDMTETQDSRV